VKKPVHSTPPLTGHPCISARSPWRAHRIATLKAAMINMLEGGFISEHDYNIGCRVAETMCGRRCRSGQPGG